MMKLNMVFLVALLIIPSLASAIECHTNKDGGISYWSWRLVDGKRCWYEGRPGKDKAELRWAKPQRVALDTKPVDAQAPLVPAWVKTIQVLPPGVVQLTPQQHIDASFNMLFVDQAQITGDQEGFKARLRELGERRWRDIQRGR